MPPGAAMVCACVSTFSWVSKTSPSRLVVVRHAPSTERPHPGSEPVAPEHLGPTSSTCVRWYCCFSAPRAGPFPNRLSGGGGHNRDLAAHANLRQPDLAKLAVGAAS